YLNRYSKQPVIVLSNVPSIISLLALLIGDLGAPLRFSNSLDNQPSSINLDHQKVAFFEWKDGVVRQLGGQINPGRAIDRLSALGCLLGDGEARDYLLDYVGYCP